MPDGEDRHRGRQQGGADGDQGDLPAGHPARDDGAVLDLGRDGGRRHVSGAGIGLQPGERGCGRQDGGGQADQDGGDTVDVTDGVHDGLLLALGWVQGDRMAAGPRPGSGVVTQFPGGVSYLSAVPTRPSRAAREAATSRVGASSFAGTVKT